MSADSEIFADAVVVAAGAIESARLLLLSTATTHPDGVGNNNGLVGANLLFHHIWAAHLEFDEALYPGRSGPEMAQSRQFLDPEGRGGHGGILLQLPSTPYFPFHEVPSNLRNGADVVRLMKPRVHCELLWLHAESLSSEKKRVRLGLRRDRFGDPFAHVRYESVDFDKSTFLLGMKLVDLVAEATEARTAETRAQDDYSSGFHHMGTCRMGKSPAEGVVDSYGEVHDARNLFVAGGSVFPGSGAVHPTLTIVAIAIRTAEHLADRLAGS
jgi:glucose dehydrogenase